MLFWFFQSNQIYCQKPQTSKKKIPVIMVAKVIRGEQVAHGHFLTRKQYYHEIGIYSYNQKYQQWKILLDVWSSSSTTWHFTNALQACKCPTFDCQMVLCHCTSLFKEMERENDWLFSNKQKAMPRSLNSLQGPDKPNIKDTYGNGAWILRTQPMQYMCQVVQDGWKEQSSGCIQRCRWALIK